MYSLGVVLSEILTGAIPYDGVPAYEIPSLLGDERRRFQLPAEPNAELRDWIARKRAENGDGDDEDDGDGEATEALATMWRLIQAALHVMPAQRPTAAQLLCAIRDCAAPAPKTGENDVDVYFQGVYNNSEERSSWRMNALHRESSRASLRGSESIIAPESLEPKAL